MENYQIATCTMKEAMQIGIQAGFGFWIMFFVAGALIKLFLSITDSIVPERFKEPSEFEPIRTELERIGDKLDRDNGK